MVLVLVELVTKFKLLIRQHLKPFFPVERVSAKGVQVVDQRSCLRDHFNIGLFVCQEELDHTVVSVGSQEVAKVGQLFLRLELVV